LTSLVILIYQEVLPFGSVKGLWQKVCGLFIIFIDISVAIHHTNFFWTTFHKAWFKFSDKLCLGAPWSKIPYFILSPLTLRRLMTYIYIVPHRLPPDVAFYIFSQQIYVLNNFKHAAHSPFFSLQNAVCFIMLPFLVHVLFTFYKQNVLILKKNSGAKGLKSNRTRNVIFFFKLGWWAVSRISVIAGHNCQKLLGLMFGFSFLKIKLARLHCCLL
jgi:hypothetical protein